MANKTTDILTEILYTQARRTIDGQTAVRRILDEVRKQIIGDIASAPADSFTGYRQQQMLGSINRLISDAEVSMRMEINQGLIDSYDAGKTMLSQMATVGSNVTLTTFGISTGILDQIQAFTWGKISGITNDAQAKIRSEITLGLLGQKTPHEISSAIAGTLERPGIFKSISARAEVIVKTEMGRTFSMAAQSSFENALDSLPDLEKMWLHAGHPKSPRIYHLHLNGEVKPVDAPFLVGSVIMRYPRDPKAPISEVINCGCMHVPYMPEWGTKKEYESSWTKAQKMANKP